MSKILNIGGVHFHQALGSPDTRGVSSSEEFVLVKTDTMLEYYQALTKYEPKDIFEIGMYEGGSLVYFDKLFQPTTLVGLDARKEPISALEAYRADNQHIKTYYGRYQEKAGTLMAAKENFPSGIDLVIDDASHLYEQTKETFNLIFPLVKAGGLYIIEDWGWAHMPAHQDPEAVWADKPAMSNLILELVVMTSQYSVIDSIEIKKELVCIRKGEGHFSSDMFDLSGVLRGKALPAL